MDSKTKEELFLNLCLSKALEKSKRYIKRDQSHVYGKNIVLYYQVEGENYVTRTEELDSWCIEISIPQNRDLTSLTSDTVNKLVEKIEEYENPEEIENKDLFTEYELADWSWLRNEDGIAYKRVDKKGESVYFLVKYAKILSNTIDF